LILTGILFIISKEKMLKKRIPGLVGVFVLLLGAVAGISLLRNRQEIREKAAASASIWLSAPPSVVAGEPFDINIEVDPGSNLVVGLELEMSFDPRYLSISGISLGTFLPGQVDIVRNEIDNNAGTISYVIWINPTSRGYASARGTAATIHATAVSPVASTSVDIGPGSLIASYDDPGNNVLQTASGLVISIVSPTPTLLPTATPTVTPTSLPTPTYTTTPTLTPTPTISLTPTPTCQVSAPVFNTAKITPDDNTLFSSKTSSVQTSVSVSSFGSCGASKRLEFWMYPQDDPSMQLKVCEYMSALENVDYECDLFIPRPLNQRKFVWKAIAYNESGSTSIERSIRIAYEGDCDLSGRVDIVDYGIFFDSFAKVDFDERADINSDGVVNVVDYSYLFYNFGKAI
jgi:hypothetical protein